MLDFSWLVDFFESCLDSLYGIFFVIFLTGAGLPVPEEFIVITAAVKSSGENPVFNPLVALSVCIIAGLMGDSLLYMIGYHWGHGIFKRFPWFARLVSPEREAQVEQKLQQHGLKILLIARFLVGIRAPIYLAAGIIRVSYRRFLLIDAMSATLVIGSFFGLGFYFADSIHEIYKRIRELEIATSVLVTIGIIVAIIVYFRRRSREEQATSVKTEEDPPSPPSKDSSHPSRSSSTSVL